MAHSQAIETERLLLRQVNESDAEAVFHNWASDPEVTKYMTWNPHETIEVTKGIMKKWLKDYEDPKVERFGIVIKETGELIGMIDIVDMVDGSPEIGYCLSRKCWGKGYMTEACKAFMDYLFSLGYSEIWIRAVAENIGSNRVIQKCGFAFVGQHVQQASSLKPWLVTINCYKKTK